MNIKTAYYSFLEKLYDHKVMDIVKISRLIPTPKGISTPPRQNAYRVEELANMVKRSQRSVTRSLRRLEKLGKVKGTTFGWVASENLTP